MTLLNRFQFVWWWHPRWWCLWWTGFGEPLPRRGPHKGCVYRWRFSIGPLEIRRWGEWPGGEA